MKCLCRAAPSGYLPAADDYEDQAGARNDDLGVYGDDDLGGYSDPAASADDGYGAPAVVSASNIDPSYAAPEADPSLTAAAGYAGPASAGAEGEYSAPRTAGDDSGAPGQYQGDQNGSPLAFGVDRQDSESAGSGPEEARLCPGGSLDVCVEVCPEFTARLYRACVQGCGDRCPADLIT